MGFIRKIFSPSVLPHILFIAFLAAIIFYTVFGDQGLYQLHSLYNTKNRVINQIKENRSQIEHFEKEKKRLITPVYLESIIRKELGYIKDGEIVYQINP